MGICMSSVAVWKEKVVYAGRRRGEVAGAEDVGGVGAGGGCGGPYGLLGGDADADVLEIEEEAAEKVVKCGAEAEAALTVAAGGTPARPIWQRKVLMGVKCQLPRFSGMILYDERGRPVCSGVRDRARDKEKHAAAIMVLRDML
ncbi:hypothetical protein OsI_06981 [Oryza sativa Indica Group]|uniref:Uncharacterized protein n=4 Tax=Oryza TaxID=4527 RepID=A0A0E0NDW9_ORYRU|nr:uncharacterized protein LOC127763705 [Oryza glaberrima]EAY85609.1 hypothetical protein OsI_06981 [Oryza sativa Indica Group]